jgi:hypothetical protein
MSGRKVIVEAWIEANGETTVQGEVVAVQVPEYLLTNLLNQGERED